MVKQREKHIHAPKQFSRVVEVWDVNDKYIRGGSYENFWQGPDHHGISLVDVRANPIGYDVSGQFYHGCTNCHGKEIHPGEGAGTRLIKGVKIQFCF